LLGIHQIYSTDWCLPSTVGCL